MPKSKKANEEYCPICGQFIEVNCTGYASSPFIDGRTYTRMCFICFSIPKMYDFDDATQTVIYYEEMNPKRLHTVEEMEDDGWSSKEDKESVRISIKAVKAAIKKKKASAIKQKKPS